ncbi:hypothetical protein GCM10023321_44940 [Pseudonocardia eucalypti]|uniref:Phosphatidic acid phosphatase type 2/haloperoxidase domain-containing protein n=1 Tax=Pseudonocardia eucalypti TaxID=648755 RepID=A0ABP9QGI7_9PSEU|nr:undecaprenyl-diphosphatase [Pseudonocardia eucalypti]
MSLTGLDTTLFLAINNFARATPWLQPLVRAYAVYGVALFAVLLLAGWWSARTDSSRTPPRGTPLPALPGRPRATARMAAALWAPLGVLVAVGANQPLVALVGEPRPAALYTNLLLLVPASSDPALPSDHAVMAGASAAGLFLVSRRLGWWTSGAAVVMAFARVCVGAHQPWDVISGLGFGAVISPLGYVLSRRVLAWAVQVAATMRPRPLVTTEPLLGVTAAPVRTGAVTGEDLCRSGPDRETWTGPGRSPA